MPAWGLLKRLALWTGKLTRLSRLRRRGSSDATDPPASNRSSFRRPGLVPHPSVDDGAPPILDSGAFPHLLDGIIAASAPRELIALRQTSTAARRQADAVLFQHVALVALDYPVFEYWNGADLSVRLPLEPLLDATNADHKARLAHTRALDIYPAGARSTSPAATPTIYRAHWASGVWPPATLPSGVELDVVRRADTTLPHPRAATLVDYIDLTDPDPPDAGFIHASGEYDSYVLHLSFVQQPDKHPRGLVVRGAKRSHGIKNVTLVLAPVGDGFEHVDYGALLASGRADRFDVLLPFMHSLVPWLAGGAQLTLVGAERCHPLYIGVTPDFPVESRRRRRWRLRGYLGDDGSAAETISEALKTALRSRVYEISVADANFGRSQDENWHWDRNEFERVHEIAESVVVVGYDEWLAEQDKLVGEWCPSLPV